MITHHTQLLNALIEKYGYKSYLEIGVQNPANNFDKIRCITKCGVDPEVIAAKVFNMTSDDFFNMVLELDYIIQNTFDLIFIDGDHTKKQVKRDFENSLRCLSPHGRIVIHDVLPENESGTIVPRQTKQWWGDVYKWAMNIYQYGGIRYMTLNIDNGCMVVWKDEKIPTDNNGYVDIEYTWKQYKDLGYSFMNVTDVVEI